MEWRVKGYILHNNLWNIFCVHNDSQMAAKCRKWYTQYKYIKHQYNVMKYNVSHERFQSEIIIWYLITELDSLLKLGWVVCILSKLYTDEEGIMKYLSGGYEARYILTCSRLKREGEETRSEGKANIQITLWCMSFSASYKLKDKLNVARGMGLIHWLLHIKRAHKIFKIPIFNCSRNEECVVNDKKYHARIWKKGFLVKWKFIIYAWV